MNPLKRIRSARRYFRVFLRSRRPWTPAEPITVVSPGGVATTTLMQHIGRFAKLNSHGDTDGLKHRPEPPAALHDDQRLLFIYGPLDKAVASLERRGWLRIQSAKLGSLIGAYSPKLIRRRAFKSAATRQMEFFEKAEKDNPQKIRCITFDELWTKQREIANFLQIDDPEFISEFPERKSRKSDSPTAGG